MSGQKMYDFSKFAKDAEPEVLTIEHYQGKWAVVRGGHTIWDVFPSRPAAASFIESQVRKSDKYVSGDMATDPPVSEAQRKAMFAAKAGKSNLGIPQKVGAEFAKADPGGSLPKRKT